LDGITMSKPIGVAVAIHRNCWIGAKQTWVEQSWVFHVAFPFCLMVAYKKVGQVQTAGNDERDMK
jgi:hypothetical protein